MGNFRNSGRCLSRGCWFVVAVLVVASKLAVVAPFVAGGVDCWFYFLNLFDPFVSFGCDRFLPVFEPETIHLCCWGLYRCWGRLVYRWSFFAGSSLTINRKRESWNVLKWKVEFEFDNPNHFFIPKTEQSIKNWDTCECYLTPLSCSTIVLCIGFESDTVLYLHKERERGMKNSFFQSHKKDRYCP